MSSCEPQIVCARGGPSRCKYNHAEWNAESYGKALKKDQEELKRRCEKKRETRWVERKKPKSQKQYDSTLGYPGEGPAEKLRMCTFNVNGLNEKGLQKMRDLMKWANEKTLDVIFIQEHNLGINKHTKWRNVCRQHGYCIIHGIHTKKADMAVRAHRGATALLLKMSTFKLTEHDSETQESTEGRLTCKKVIWKDMILPLVSMYVPVNPVDRKTFLKKISNNKRTIPPGAIIGGDFNCVENITFDTLKEDGGIYQNHHGGVVTTMMRSAEHR